MDEEIGGAVHHPRHYNVSPSGVECIDVIEHMPFNTGTAMKYLWRYGEKDSAKLIEDLKKAVWYTEREIARLTGPKKETSLEKHLGRSGQV